MKKSIAMLLALVLCLGFAAGCSSNTSTTTTTAPAAAETPAAAAETAAPAAEAPAAAPEDNGTHIVVDASGDEIEVPNSPKCVVIGTMVLPNMVYALQGHANNVYAIPPAAYSGWEISALSYLAPEMGNARTDVVDDNFDINIEECLNAGVDLVIAFDSNTDAKEQLSAVGIPCVMVKTATDIESLKTLLSIVADALNCQARGEEVAKWYDDATAYFDSKQAAVSALSADEMPRVLVVQRVGKLSMMGGGMMKYIINRNGGEYPEMKNGNQLSMEEIISYDPEILFLSNFDDVTPEQLYNNSIDGQDWSNITAVKNHRVYKIPAGLYRWAPPNTFEKPFFMYWTAQYIQPDIYNDYDLRAMMMDFYKNFYGYELTEAQLDVILRTEVNSLSK